MIFLDNLVWFSFLSDSSVGEMVLQGLDYVIVEARKRGIRLILSLVNNLNAFGGKA